MPARGPSARRRGRMPFLLSRTVPRSPGSPKSLHPLYICLAPHLDGAASGHCSLRSSWWSIDEISVTKSCCEQSGARGRELTWYSGSSTGGGCWAAQDAAVRTSTEEVAAEWSMRALAHLGAVAAVAVGRLDAAVPTSTKEANSPPREPIEAKEEERNPSTPQPQARKYSSPASLGTSPQPAGCPWVGETATTISLTRGRTKAMPSPTPTVPRMVAHVLDDALDLENQNDVSL